MKPRHWIGLSIAGVLLVVSLLAYISGHQRPIDSVQVARDRYSIALRSETVATNGIRLHVVEAGPPDGPLVVLLHGYPEFWWGWKEQLARLAKAGMHVVVPDQRGYNSSDKPRDIAAYRPNELVADVVGLIDHYGGKADLAGHDWGGFVAWRVAISRPDSVRRLVVFNMAHPLAFDDLKKLDNKPESISWYRTFFQIPVVPEVTGRIGNWYMLVKSLQDSSRPGTFTDDELAHYRYAWDRDGAMRTMINWYRAGYRYPDKLEGDATVSQPTLIVWGTKDPFVPAALAELSAKHCTQAQVVKIDNAGHWLLHEEPETTSRQLIDFFRS